MNSTNSNREIDILRIVKEDVLRILGERREKVSTKVIELEIKASSSFLFKTIKNLEEDNLIDVEENFILLTKNGRKEAKDIVKKHNIIEDYFRETRTEREAHQAAHILEHYVSEEVINNIKKLSTLKKEGIPLTKFQLNSKGIITDIFLSNYELFERIVSMGIFLGEMIFIQNDVPHALIVKIRNKKFALDKNIAKEIRALRYE